MRNYLSILSSLALAAGTAAAQPAGESLLLPSPDPAPVDTAPPPTTGDPPPAEPKPEEKKHANVGYDKGFFIKSDDGKYSLKITGRVQPFFNSLRTDEPRNFANNFEVRRARLVLEGNIHTKKLLYKMQSDFGKGFVTLKDFHADVELADDVWVRVGQWKRPFSRQQITSSGRLEVTDRAITDKAFGAGRDIGLAIRNDYEKSPDLEWIVGVFNGTGDASKITSVTTTDPMTMITTTTTTLPTNVPKEFKPAIVGRVGINRNGLKGYSEADLEGGPLRFGAALSVLLEGDFDENDQSNQKAEVDAIVKVEGASISGAFYTETAQNGDGVLDLEQSLIGFHLQAGYMVVPKHWQVVGRYALVNDVRTADPVAADQQEISVGGNYFGFGHDAKIAAAVRFIKAGDASFTDSVLFELGANVGF